MEDLKNIPEEFSFEKEKEIARSFSKRFQWEMMLIGVGQATVWFLKEYRTAQLNRSAEQIREERWEARAAFGPGETIVNMITGEKYTT